MTPLSNSDRPRRVTIRDVASEAGVGIKTVSRVVNGEPNVTPATADRVRRAMELLQWEPDAHASNLRRTNRRTRTIGLLLGSVSNPFAATMHRAIEDSVAERDIAVFASSLDEDPERERAAVEAFVRRKVDGLILTCASPSQGYLEELVPPGMPVVFVDRPPVDFAAPAVLIDNRGAARRAVEHLIAHGHRRIACLLDRPDIWTAAERRRGFEDAIAAHGLDPEDCPVVEGLTEVGPSEEAVGRLLDGVSPPTAVFSAQNLITIGTIRALRARSLRERVAHVGFDDIELGDVLDPGMTVVAQNPFDIGLAAARLLLDDPETRAASPLTLIETTLIRRGSGEIPA